jgi:hypothetical protein
MLLPPSLKKCCSTLSRYGGIDIYILVINTSTFGKKILEQFSFETEGVENKSFKFSFLSHTLLCLTNCTENINMF